MRYTIAYTNIATKEVSHYVTKLQEHFDKNDLTNGSVFGTDLYGKLFETIEECVELINKIEVKNSKYNYEIRTIYSLPQNIKIIGDMWYLKEI